RSYCVLWMSFSGAAVLAQVVRYRRQQGWDRLYRGALSHPSGRLIYRRLGSDDGLDSHGLELLRADMLILLAEQLKRALRETPNQARPLSSVEKHLNHL